MIDSDYNIAEKKASFSVFFLISFDNRVFFGNF